MLWQGRADIQLGQRDLASRVGRLVVVQVLHDAGGALLGPVGAGNIDANQNIDRTVLGELRREVFRESDPGRQKARSDIGLPGIVARSDVVIIVGDHDDALRPRVGDDFGEGVIVRNCNDQGIGVGGQRRVYIGELFLDRHVRVGEEKLTVRLDLGAGVVESLFDGLPELVRRGAMSGHYDFERSGGGRSGKTSPQNQAGRGRAPSPSLMSSPILCGLIKSSRSGVVMIFQRCCKVMLRNR